MGLGLDFVYLFTYLFIHFIFIFIRGAPPITPGNYLFQAIYVFAHAGTVLKKIQIRDGWSRQKLALTDACFAGNLRMCYKRCNIIISERARRKYLKIKIAI